MAKTNELYSALSACGFETSGLFCFGTWRGYAVTLRPWSGRAYYLDVAVRAGKWNAKLYRQISKSLKERKVRNPNAAGVGEKTAIFQLRFRKAEDPCEVLASALNTVTEVLRENGLAPADSCAITGAAQPDSLSLVSVGDHYAFQPVSAAALRAGSDREREKAEDNELNGSYALGLVGALLGMLVGLVPNLLTIVLDETIYAILFALVPICAMFGYKLFRGRMNKASIVITLLMSLLGVPLIEFFELVIYLMRDYAATLGEALAFSAEAFRDPAFLSDAVPDFLQLLLFMGLGVAFASGVIFRQTNSLKLRDDEARLSTLRPNPLRSDGQTPR